MDDRSDRTHADRSQGVIARASAAVFALALLCLVPSAALAGAAAACDTVPPLNSLEISLLPGSPAACYR